VTRRREAHNVRSLVQGLLSHLELANQQYDKYYSNNRNNFQQKVSEIVKSFLGNMDDIVKMFPYVEKFRNDTRLADLRHGKILSKQELHQLLLDLDKIRSSNDIGPIIINSEDKTDDLL
jgi:hypothetical protein